MTQLSALQIALLYDTAGILAGFLLDLCFGDPAGRFHPVCLIGRLVRALEKRLLPFDGARRGGGEAEKQTAAGGLTAAQQLRRGILSEIAVLLFSGAVAAALLTGMILLHPLCGFLAGALLSDAALAARDLQKESMRVYDALPARKDRQSAGARRSVRAAEGAACDLAGARRALSRIVGRDTEKLDEAGIIRAAVETVAENASDGVTAPLFYLCLGGPVLAWLYKAVNTMDSMLGYKNERYLYYGRAAARTDDFWNFLPARCCGLYLCAAAFLLRMDYRAAARVMERDARKSTSPNAGWPEAAVAGALGVRLLGDASYFGEIKHKETIGDGLREIEAADIVRANRLMMTASALALADVLFFRLLLFFLLGRIG